MLKGGAREPHKIQGIGAGFVPSIYDSRQAVPCGCVDRRGNHAGVYATVVRAGTIHRGQTIYRA